MKKFTLGAIAGISSLALAVPLLAQVSNAASGGSSSTGNLKTRPAPSQACVQALAAKDGAYLTNIDAIIAAQKTATKAHQAALTAAAGITDDAQRQAAVQKADADFRTAMQAAMQSQSGAMKAQMDAIRAACGKTLGAHGMMGFGGGMGGMMMGKGGRGGFGHGRMGRPNDNDADDAPSGTTPGTAGATSSL